jgi:hypothetical protein
LLVTSLWYKSTKNVHTDLYVEISPKCHKNLTWGWTYSQAGFQPGPYQW